MITLFQGTKVVKPLPKSSLYLKPTLSISRKIHQTAGKGEYEPSLSPSQPLIFAISPEFTATSFTTF